MHFLPSLEDKTVDKYLKPPYKQDRIQANERTLNSISEAHKIEWEEIDLIDCPIPSNDPPEVIEERIRIALEESNKLTEWPDVDNYVDD